LEVLLDEMDKWNKEKHKMQAALLVSINRTESSEQAIETVQICIGLKHPGIYI
jgi:hypothetical protein